MPHTQPGGPVRWIVGGLSAAALVAGVGLLLSDISRRQPPRLPSPVPEDPTAQSLSGTRAFATSSPSGNVSLSMPFPNFEQLWRMTPTTFSLTKLPEEKAFFASFHMLCQVRAFRYGFRRGGRSYSPLPPEELAKIMIETKAQEETNFPLRPFMPGIRLWQIVRLKDDFYLRVWKLPQGVQPFVRYSNENRERSMSMSGRTTIGSSPSREIVNGVMQNGKTPSDYKFTFYNRPDHPNIPSGVKAEPTQLPLQVLGMDNYRESSGEYFGCLQFDSVQLDNRAKEKWSSLPLPPVPPEMTILTRSGRMIHTPVPVGKDGKPLLPKSGILRLPTGK